MRKTMKQLTALFWSILLCLCIVTIPVFAASESHNGLDISLVTNKESYNQNEEIVVTLSVKNTNDFAVTNLSLENIIPNGYKLDKDSVATKQISSLEEGESADLKVIYVTKSSNKPSAEDTGKESKPENGSNHENQPSTGDNSNIFLWGAIIILSIISIITVLRINKKHSKKFFSMFLCLTMTGSIVLGMSSVAEAAKSQKKSISISKSVKVGASNLEINAIVKYDEVIKEDGGNTKPIKPENPSEEEEYYWENSEVIDVIDVQESEDVLTEADAITYLKERGFDDYPVTYDYSINGEYNDETEALETSTDKHPIYQTYYLSKNDKFFTIYVINSSIIAYPVSFNLDSNSEAELLISESEKLTSYIDEVNKFYVTIPKSSSAIVKTIDRIDAETIEKLAITEINE